jgi:hypothetical protein
VNGKLTATVPLAAVCHDGSNTHPDWPAYNEAACTALQQKWYVKYHLLCIIPTLTYPFRTDPSLQCVYVAVPS